ncbi:MAG: hypothetical protein Q4B53_02650 [Lachnospiraceae bacterium]|nr:hypothetical protein [Lachnospiraceae bacterium]
MKNKTVNKKVLRAMSIGLAAMMTVQPILATPVFADDTEPVDDSNTTTYDEEKHESETTDEAREAVDTATDSAQAVADDVNAIKTDIPVIDQETGAVLNQASLVPGALDKVGDTLKVVDADLTIVENYLTDEKKITGSGYNEAYNANVQAYVAAVAVYGEEGPSKPLEGAEDYEAALKAYNDFQALKAEIDKHLGLTGNWNTEKVLKPAIKDVTAENFVSETEANSNIATAVGEANDAVKGAAEEQAKADEAGKEAAEFIGNTEAQFKDYVDEIKNAATIDAANESYDKLVEMLNNAGTTLEEKQKVYDDALTAYNDYKKKYDEQKKAIEDAKKAYEDAQRIYNDAATSYGDWSNKHDQKVKDLTIYHDTLADAEKKYEDAVKELNKIEKQADDIAKAATAAKASILANGGNTILAAIEVTEKSSSRVWGEQDKLFEEIVKNYYVPEVLKGEIKSLNWTKISEDMCNYCVVTYTDKEGNEQTLVLDYVMTNADGSVKTTTDEIGGRLNGNSTSKIVIFEKSEDERKAADELKNNKDALLYDEGINVDKYKVVDAEGKPVYLNKSYVEGELAKKDGSIINFNGVYYQKGEATTDVKLTYDENGLVSDTTNDAGDERTVITVESKVEAADLKLEDGKFVQEYKGDTTTIVYHKGLSESALEYNSKEEAEAALEAAKKDIVGAYDELINGETVDETHTEYTTSGTYIPIFSETIDIDENCNVKGEGFLGIFNGNEDDAIKKAENNASGLYGDYYILDKSFNLTAEQAKKTESKIVGWTGVPIFSKPIYGDVEVDDEGVYNVSGTATFTYVSKTLVTEEKASEWLGQDVYSTIAGWFGGNVPSSAEIQNMVAEKLKADGKILVSWNVPDGNWGKASYAYINKASVAVSGDACASEKLAEESFEKALAAAVNNSEYKGRTENAQLLKGTYTDLLGNEIDLVNSSTDSKDITKYGYNLSYWNQTSKTTENTLIKTETSDASKVYGVVVQNQDGATVLNQVTDEKFNAFIENIKAQNARFEKLEADAKKAQEDVKTAQDKVKALEEAINKIKGTKIKGNGKDQGVKQVNGLKVLALLEDVKLSEYTLDELKAFLETAQGQLDDAKARLAKLNEQLADAEEARDNRITELTPTPAPAPTTGGGETTPAGGGTTTAPISTLATALAGAPTFALPTGGVAAPTAGVAGARTSRSAAADSDTSDATDTTAKIAPEKEVEEDALAITKDTIKTIKDKETPLSSLTEDSAKKMNWWWLLLIALLGATGEEIYRRNKKKKEEEAALKAEVDKNN